MEGVWKLCEINATLSITNCQWSQRILGLECKRGASSEKEEPRQKMDQNSRNFFLILKELPYMQLLQA